MWPFRESTIPRIAETGHWRELQIPSEIAMKVHRLMKGVTACRNNNNNVRILLWQVTAHVKKTKSALNQVTANNWRQ